MKPMTDQERAEFVRGIAQHCNAARNAGLPGWGRVLREAVFFFWEIRRKGKFDKTRPHSLSARRLTSQSGKRYDHAIPFKLLRERLLAHCDDPEAFLDVLESEVIAVIVTDEDNSILNSAGLNSSMPTHWDGHDPFARYAAAGIVISHADRAGPVA